MRKLIGVLCCVMALAAGVAAQAKSFSVDKNLEILQMFGVDQDVSMNTLNTEKEVTRAAFVYNVAALMNMDVEASENVYYHDVSRDYWAFNAISSLTERGIISGDENSMFRPDDAITKLEAVKILTAIMGYNDYAEMSGGWPAGYIAAANSANLYDGCSSSQTLTAGDMYAMLVNALTGPTMVIQYDANGISYEIDEDTTILSSYYDMYLADGTLTGADGIDILDSAPIPENQVVIDGTMYSNADVNAADYLGIHVDYIYRERDSDDAELIWISADTKNETLMLDHQYDCEYDAQSYTLTYTDTAGKSKKARLDPGFVMVYNGAATSSNVDEILNRKHSTIKLIRTAGSASYNLAVVWSYENYFVGSVDKAQGLIYDKNTWNSISLLEEAYDSCVIKIGGSVSTLDNITEDMIVSVYKSLDGRRILAEAASSTVNGTISNVSEKNGEKVITVNGSVYKMFSQSDSFNCKAGDIVTLYLDVNGYVGGIKSSTGNGAFGYIIKAYEGDFTGEEFYIRMIDSNGEIKNYKCADNIRVDGMKMDVEDLKIKFIPGDVTARQLIWFKTDSNGLLKTVDTTELGAGESAKTSLQEYQGESNLLYRSSSGKMGTKIYVDDNTKIFAVPNSSETASNEDYMIKSRKDLVDDVSYMTSVYRLGTELLDYEEVIVIKGKDWSAASNTDPLLLVSDIQKGLNADEEVVDIIHGYRGAEEVWLTCESGFSCENYGVDTGDTIRVGYSLSGEVADAVKYYDYSERRGTVLNASSLNAALRIGTVYANDKVGNMIFCGYNDGTSFDEVFNLSGVTVLVYDSEAGKNKVRIGTVGDIKTYKMTQSIVGCSTMVIHTNWMNPIAVVVYN